MAVVCCLWFNVQFIARLRRHIHVVVCMSPFGEAFRNRLRMFPALVNCTTIDWFSEWPAEALHSVAEYYVADPTLELGHNTQPVISVRAWAVSPPPLLPVFSLPYSFHYCCLQCVTVATAAFSLTVREDSAFVGVSCLQGVLQSASSPQLRHADVVPGATVDVQEPVEVKACRFEGVA